jgi:hypothetical protein
MGSHHPSQGQARRRHARDIHQLQGFLRSGGESLAAPKMLFSFACYYFTVAAYLLLIYMGS